ncbi:MAG: di-heme oxidoredictase family protein [Gemmatimonadota bacterium]
MVATPEPLEPGRRLAGGATTVDDGTSHGFSIPAPNLDPDRLDFHLDGDLAFEQVFVRAPAPVNPGLGPVFNAQACDQCHDRDGRTRDAFLMRLSLPTEPGAAPTPVPAYGIQLQDQSVFGTPPEGRIDMNWTEVPGVYADGTPYSLRRPDPVMVDAYAGLPAEVRTSVRMPRPVFGLGLLEAISDATLLGLADAADADGDGISGRVNRLRSAIDGAEVIGRFGWKANQPSLLEQTAAAYREDMGVTNSIFPAETSSGQLGQDDSLGDDPELSDEELAAATFYVQTLAVPAARRIEDAEVVTGERLFRDAGCTGCHVPRLETGTFSDVPEVSRQVIYPYTDLLLHDMGPELADGRSDWDATGSEWRTPPLWGIGLSRLVNGHTDLLHDGRARSPEEAILWHGGEGASSRDFFRNLSALERDALIAFLESL